MNYKFKWDNFDKKIYCQNLKDEAAQIQREIEKLTVKREMLQDFAMRLDMDLIEVSCDSAVGSQISANCGNRLGEIL